MEIQEQTQVNEAVDTVATDEQVDTQQENQQETQASVDTQAKTFTQEQVNELVRERIERERSGVYRRYGVEDKHGLDELIAKSQSYEVMKERYGKIMDDYSKLNQEHAFLKNNINPDKQDDVLAYFKGKELDFSNDKLAEELKTHPEWLCVKTESDKPKTTINFVSPERSHSNSVDEKEVAAKMFGLKKIL